MSAQRRAGSNAAKLAELARVQQRFMLAGLTGRAPSVSGALNAVAAKGIAPVHRKAVGNARRLARTRIR